MFQRRTNDGVVRAGLVAAAVMLFLRDPLLAPIGDFLAHRLDMNFGNMSAYMGLIAIYYFIAGLFISNSVKNSTGVAMSAGFWTVGLAVFWLLYTHTIGPVIQGVVAPAFPAPEVWALNLGVEAMAFVSVAGAFVSKLKSK